MLIDDVIRPIVESGDVEWFWFTRYHAPNRFDDNDCEWDQLPKEFQDIRSAYFYETRSMRFRFAPKHSGVEKELERLAKKHQIWYSDIRNYDPIDDLGTRNMLTMCEAACRVVLDNLDGTGRIKSEGAFHNLEQMHHRVCNIAHLTDYRSLGIRMVRECLADLDNFNYDSADRTPPL